MKTILKKSFEIYTKNFLKIAVLVIMIWIPLAIVNAFVLEPSIDIDYINEIFTKASMAGGEAFADEALVAAEKYLKYLGLTLLLTVIGIISQLSVTKLTASAYREENELCNISDSFEAGVKLFPRTLWALFLLSVLAMFGMILILPGLIMIFMSVFTIQVIVTSNVKGMKAIRYSFEIVKVSLLQTLLLIVAVFGATYLLSMGAAWVVSALNLGGIAGQILSVAVDAVLNVITSFSAVLYTVCVLEREKKTDPKILANFNNTPDKDTDRLEEL